MDFSILIAVPTFNSMNLIPHLIHSLENQTFSNWKILFIDASTSQEECDFIEKICKNNKKCSYLKEFGKEKSIYNAMNIAFNYVNEKDWLMFWGADDLAFSNDVIERIYLQISKNLERSFFTDLIVFSGEYLSQNNQKVIRKVSFSNKNEILDPNQFLKKLFFGFSLPHQATVFSPKVRLKLKSYSTKLFLASDLDYFLRLSKFKDLSVQSIPKCIVSMGDGGVSSKKHFLRFAEVMKSYIKFFGIFFLIPFFLRYFRRYLSLYSL